MRNAEQRSSSGKSRDVAGLLNDIDQQVRSAEPQAFLGPVKTAPGEPQDVWRSYLADIASYPLLPWPEQLEMFKNYVKTHDPALRDALTTANLKLVVAWARKFKSIYGSASMMDLVQEGNIGLMKAVDRFDPALGNRFSTYALPWIKSFMRRYLITQSRFPERTLAGMSQTKRAAQILSQELGREPTDAELADFLGDAFTPSKVAFLKDGGYGSDVSLDTPLRNADGDDGSGTLGDRLVDESQDPAKFANESVDAEAVRRSLARLPLRERTVLMMRLGMNEENREFSLSDIGKMYGVSKQRAKQIYDSGLKKIKDEMSGTLTENGKDHG